MATEVLQPKEARQKETYAREEYLALALDAGESEGVKHEHDDAHAYVMAETNLEHTLMAGNVRTALNARLAERACRVMHSDMRVRLPGGRYFYPDVVALINDRPASLLDPELLDEVPSDTTAIRDRTWKLDRSLQLDSLESVW